MKKIVSMLALCALLFTAAAQAETYCVNVNGQYDLLLTDAGDALTEPNVYTGMYKITLDDADHILYAASACENTGNSTDVAETALANEGDGFAESFAEAFDGEEDYGDYRIALIDENGDQLTDFDYLSLTHYPQCGVVLFTDESGLYGAMRESGEEIFPAQYAALTAFPDGRYLGVITDANGANSIVTIDEDGMYSPTETSVSQSFWLSSAGSNLAALTDYDEYGNAFVRYLNEDGSAAFPNSFIDAGAFADGYAITAVDGETLSYGVIDGTGNYVLPAVFSQISRSLSYDNAPYLAIGSAPAMYAAGVLDDEYDTAGEDCEVFILYDSTFKPLAISSDNNASWVVCSQDSSNIIAVSWTQSDTDAVLTRYFNTDGKLLLENNDPALSYDFAYTYSEGAPQRGVCTRGEWPNQVAQLVDMDLNVVSPEFQSLTAAAWQGDAGRYLFNTFAIESIIDPATGETTLQPNWDSWRYGLCDENGATLLNAEYDNIICLSFDRYWVTSGTENQLLDAAGTLYYSTDAEAAQ